VLLVCTGWGPLSSPSLSKPQTGSCGSGSALTLSTISCSANDEGLDLYREAFKQETTRAPSGSPDDQLVRQAFSDGFTDSNIVLDAIYLLKEWATAKEGIPETCEYVLDKGILMPHTEP
jgi:hypothetical protein